MIVIVIAVVLANDFDLVNEILLEERERRRRYALQAPRGRQRASTYRSST